MKPTNSYLWLCKCSLFPNDPVEPSRGAVNEFVSEPDTHIRSKATSRCLEAQRRRFTRICNREPDQFSRKAQPVLSHCVNSGLAKEDFGLAKEDQKDTGPFSFKQDKCTAAFFQCNVSGARKGIWVCQCEQEARYFVGTGRAQYNITGNVGEASKEWKKLQECTSDRRQQLQNCEGAPKDFSANFLQASSYELRH